MSGRCKTCRDWGNRVLDAYAPVQHLKTCDAQKIMFAYDFEDANRPPDAAVVEGEEGWGILTGPDFGCVHHKPREATE